MPWPRDLASASVAVADLAAECPMADSAIVLGDNDQRSVEVDAEPAQEGLPHLEDQIVEILGV